MIGSFFLFFFLGFLSKSKSLVESFAYRVVHFLDHLGSHMFLKHRRCQDSQRNTFFGGLYEPQNLHKDPFWRSRCRISLLLVPEVRGVFRGSQEPRRLYIPEG